MSIGIIGKKLGMTQIFDNKGNLIPVTVIQAGPCPVIQTKTVEKDGYSALQIGYLTAGKSKQKIKPLIGHFKTSGLKPAVILKEIRVDDVSAFKLGQNITVDQFKSAELVSVTGISKGRGFAGVIKRHGFPGKDAGHGTHEYFRHGGSIGCRTPKHVIKGMRMPGRMGAERVTLRNMKIVFVDRENHLLLIKGAVPGWNSGLVLIKKP
jgi:large subunit ribosomal protein L3